MKEEFENSRRQVVGIIPAQQEHRNAPQTLAEALATISRGQKLADEIRLHPPKTIDRGKGTTSGGCPKKKRGRGAPPGNLNALKTGRHTANARRVRKQIWQFTSQVDVLVHLAEALYGFRISPNRPRKQNWPVMPDELRRIYRERVR